MKIAFYLTLLFTAICLNGSAQSYHPFPSSNTIWAEFYSPHGDSSFRVVYYGLKDRDTVINSQTYHKLYRSADTVFQETEYVGGLRDDTAARKVYGYGPIFWGNGSQEVLLYDFNLNAGDTLKTNANNGRNNWFMNNNMRVTGVDSALIDGTWRKRMYLDFPVPTIWIEGMGNQVRGLIWFTGTYPNSGTWNELLCMKQHGQWIYHHPVGWLSSSFVIPPCDSLQKLNPPAQGIESVIPANSGVRFYPNPVRGISQLNIEEAGKFETLEIYNTTGAKMLSLRMNGVTKVTIDSKDYPVGIYHYRLQAKQGNYVSGRFIVE